MSTEKKQPCAKTAKTVSCEHCVDFLLDYVDGKLLADEQFRFESHIAYCGECETYVDNYQQTAQLARETGQDLREAKAQAGEIPQALVDAILKARKGEQ